MYTQLILILVRNPNTSGSAINGAVEDAKSLLKPKIANKDSNEFLTKKSYPMYHGVYKIEIDVNNNIIFEGNVY